MREQDGQDGGENSSNKVTEGTQILEAKKWGVDAEAKAARTIT